MGSLLQALSSLIGGGKAQPARAVRSSRAPRVREGGAGGPRKYVAFLRRADNDRYVVMLGNGEGVAEASYSERYADAVRIRDRFNAGDWTLLNDVRTEVMEDAMFHNNNPRKFADAARPPKGWQLW